MKFSESPYIKRVKNKFPEPDPDYIYELNVLRAMIRQENRQGNKGWGGRTWTKERYHRLKERYPEAVLAFEAELRWEQEAEQRIRETLEKYRHSPYIEEVEGWPDSEAKDNYLRDLRQLRDVMIQSKKLGYGGYAMSVIYRKLKDRHPQAYEAFEKEIER